METPTPDETLDLRGFICPLNFVKAKKQIETMADGQVLEVILDGGDPIARVPRQLKEEGHKVVGVHKREDETFSIFVRKGGE